ncbi:hypothetical protein [Streptomyces sp. NPDC001269]
MQTDTGTQPTQAASPQRKPLKDLRGFWRTLLALRLAGRAVQA